MVPRVGWRASWLGCLAGRVWYLVAFSDTTQTRLFLVMAAALWVIALAIPGDSFTRPTFAYMSAIVGPHAEMKWLAAFAIYALTGAWRIFSSAPGRVSSLVINALGVALFSAVAFSVATLPGVPFPAGSAAHVAIALAAMWVLVRTHVNSPTGWRHD